MAFDAGGNADRSRNAIEDQVSTIRQEIHDTLGGWNETGQQAAGDLFKRINGYKTLDETVAAMEGYRNDLTLIGDLFVHDKNILAQRRLISWDVLKRLRNLRTASRPGQSTAELDPIFRSGRFFKSDRLNGDGVVYLFDYKRKSETGECEMSEKLRDLKNMNGKAISFFARRLLNQVLGNFSICTVPGHTQRKKQSGIREVAIKLSEKSDNITDATDALERFRTIKKQALSHRKRNIERHLESIRLKDGCDVQGKDILLLDDVGTSGWSLAGCKRVLLDAGSGRVKCAVLGRTVHPDATNFSAEMRRAVQGEWDYITEENTLKTYRSGNEDENSRYRRSPLRDHQ